MNQNPFRQLASEVERLNARLDTLRGTLDGIGDALDRLIVRMPIAHEKLGRFWDRVYGEEQYSSAQQEARTN